MTEQQEPDRQRPAPPPGTGMPAGDRPPVQPPARPVGEGPTRPLGRPSGDEPTKVLGRSPGSRPADGGEPTVVSPPAGRGEPTTVRLPPGNENPDAAGSGAEAEPAAEHTPPAAAEQMPSEAAGGKPVDLPAARSAPPTAVDDEPTVAHAAPAPERSADAPGSPDAATRADADDPRPGTGTAVPEGSARPAPPPRKRLSSAGALIWVLLALFGFTLVVQLRSNDTDDSLASARQEDLVRILSDLEARDTRLQAEIAALETSQRQLTSGVEGRQAALEETRKRAGELGLLAGTLPGRGPGLEIRISGVKASAILNAVQELRGAGGEVMELAGAGGGSVRVVASTYFVDGGTGVVVVDGTRLSGPYTLWVIGPAQTMRTALEIPGGVVASVKSGGGSVTMQEHTAVDVTAVRRASSLQYARPVS